jgi:O-6-methylguanine DNA methyltransferase
MNTTLKKYVFPSKIGEIVSVFKEDQLVFLDFADNVARLERLLTRRFKNFTLEPESGDIWGMGNRLERYFAGDFTAFVGLELDFSGTDFQHRVWNALTQIEAGKTWSYSQLAEYLNAPSALRAVGTAVGQNPMMLVLPCHRVISKNGGLGGFAGGLERKKALLELESVPLL